MAIKEMKLEKRLRGHLERMRRHPGITTRELMEAAEEKITMRTVQNDLNYLRAHWQGGRIESRGGRHWVHFDKEIENLALDKEKKVYLKLALEATEKIRHLSDPAEEIAEDLGLDRLESPYFIHAEEYEEIEENNETIRELEEAIRGDHPIFFRYDEEEFYVDPLRLVNFDGIWYLYGKDREEVDGNPWKTWLLSGIHETEIEYAQRHEIPDEAVEEDLEEAPSPHFVPDREEKVRLRVAPEAAKYFRLKEFLPRQRTLREEQDGSILIECVVSRYEDLQREVKSWLPHLEILEPEEYRRRLNEEIGEYCRRMRRSLEKKNS